MKEFKVGFASVDVTPPLGVALAGYYVPRYAKEILDGLSIDVLALSCGQTDAVWISIDNCMIDATLVRRISARVGEALGLSADCVIISTTHTHTAPFLEGTVIGFEPDAAEVAQYTSFVMAQTLCAAQAAYADRRPAKMGYAVGRAPERVAYIRRYRMKDGSTMTCPPIDDPNIDAPIGELDSRVAVLRFDREGADSVVLFHYGLHADTVGGEYVSADWPHWLKKTLDKALDGVKCMVVCGAQGDVGSTNVHPTPSDMNDTEISFDNEMKSPGMARFVGRALAGVVLQVFDKVHYADVDEITLLRKTVSIPTNMPSAEQMPLAKEYRRLHEMGREDLIPYTGMELTTVVAEALRMCELEHGPTSVPMTLVGIRIGAIAAVGLPGEPFTEIGVRIKEHGGHALVLPCALTGGYFGYFPTRSAYDEGGYEARTARYLCGVGERLTAAACELLDALRPQ